MSKREPRGRQGRSYTAPTDDERCTADRSPLRDGSLARCMRRARQDGSGLCAAHARVLARFVIRASGERP